MADIPVEEIQYSALSCADEVGRVFYWQGKVFRGIYPDAAEQVKELFRCGCLDELVHHKLFPKSYITSYSLDGFAFIIEHEKLPFITYPHEWSFDMFRDAALTVLTVSEILSKFGWALKDCHPYNLLFYGCRPMYVDLGSFVPRPSNLGPIIGRDFLQLYIRPLSIWKVGNAFLARRIISSGHEMLTSLSWFLYKVPVLRWVSVNSAHYWIRAWERFLGLCTRLIPRSTAIKRKNVFDLLLSYLPADLLIRRPITLRRKIERFAAPKMKSDWHNYHSEYINGKSLISTSRFDKIVEIICSLGCESVVELAGNQGLLSLLLLTRSPVSKIVCTDYDDIAINHLYNYCSELNGFKAEKILQPAVINFMIPEQNFYTYSPSDRLKADLVIALAVTHHLTLSQNFQLRHVIQTIASYTNKFAIIEFMPLGLWDGKNSSPIPNWYKLEWFQKSFEEFFDLLKVEEVESNRIVHLGKLKIV